MSLARWVGVLVLAAEAEPRGEAVAFTLDAAAYLTVSEGSTQPLWRFARR